MSIHVDAGSENYVLISRLKLCLIIKHPSLTIKSEILIPKSKIIIWLEYSIKDTAIKRSAPYDKRAH